MKRGDMPAMACGQVRKQRVNQNDPGSDFAVMATLEPRHKGLTIREQFAMAAMQGFCAAPEFAQSSVEELADSAVLQADALLAELERTGEKS